MHLQAWELAYFGANVLHPRTTQPAMKYSIPITLRNFFNLDAPGPAPPPPPYTHTLPTPPSSGNTKLRHIGAW